MNAPPPPSSALVSRKMSQQPSRDTKPELALRKALHHRGLRFRVHQRPLPDVRRTIDIVFRPALTAVEVRGCYWHACPTHCRKATVNAEWWAEKLGRNVERDRETERLLREAGWELVVVWEHDDVERAAEQVEGIVRARRARPPALS